MSSGAVDGRLVALLVIILLACQVSGMEAEDLCQQFKSGRATIALLTTTRDGKFLLLDDHFRGYLVPKDHFHMAWGIASDTEPPWLNLTAQSPIQVDVGQETPPPTNGRGVFYFTKDQYGAKKETYLGVLWSNLTTVTIVPFDPPGPALIRNWQKDDFIDNRAIPNIFFMRILYGPDFYRPSFTRDSLISIELGISSVDTVKVYSGAARGESPYNLTTLDGGFISDKDFYAFSNCAKAIFKLESNKWVNKKKRHALRLADFILCSATDQPAKSYSPEADIVPAECYQLEPELTYPPTLAPTEALIGKLFKIYFVMYILGTVAISLYIYFRAKPSPAAAGSRRGGHRPKVTSRHSSRTSTSTSKRGRSRSGGARRSSRTKSTKR